QRDLHSFPTRRSSDLTQTFPDVEYHPDQFPGLVFRLKSPKTATLIFSSGKMVCTGAKSEEQAIKAVRSVVQKLRKGGIKIKKDRSEEHTSELQSRFDL